MATPTYTPIASITLGSSASSVTFSSIPQNYRDLVLVFNGNGTSDSFLFSYPNSDTGNATQVIMQGNGSNTSSSAFSGLSWGTINTGGKTQAILQWMDYSVTDKHKTVLIRDPEGIVLSIARAARWASTAAITSLEIVTNSGLVTAGSTFALYGIEA